MPAPTLNQIRDALKLKVESVSGTGKVHDYERFSKEPSKLLELYKSNRRFHGYHVRRVSTREVQAAVGRYVVSHGWQLRGFMGIDDADATEKLFDTEIEQIRDALRDDDTLGGLIATMITDDQAGAQVIESGPVMFCDVLSHSARLALTTVHFQ